jgi:hypothetical protein
VLVLVQPALDELFSLAGSPELPRKPGNHDHLLFLHVHDQGIEQTLQDGFYLDITSVFGWPVASTG